MTPALFLDRDGVINVDHGYVHRVEDFEFMPGIFAFCRLALDLGLRPHVVTNQAGIGRGYYTGDDFRALSEWMVARFAKEGVAIDGVHHCPHHPTAGLGAYRRDCPRRKPSPGMLLDAARDHRLDLGRSVMIGDKAGDMAAALAAGVPHRLWLGGGPDSSEAIAVPDLGAARRHLATLAGGFGKR